VEIRILEQRSNPLLKRHEYVFEAAHAAAATPSRDAVRGELSKLVAVPKERVVIERMRARYGTATTRGDAFVYESVDAAKAIARAHILVRNGLKEKAAPAAAAPAPAEAPKAEPAPEVAPAAPTEAPKAAPKAKAPKPEKSAPSESG